jgi:hypothetical protein
MLSIGEALDSPNELHWKRGKAARSLCGKPVRNAGLLPEWWRASFYGAAFAQKPQWCRECEERLGLNVELPNEARITGIARALRELGKSTPPR